MTQSNAKSQMLSLRGSAALSQFRIEKIQKKLSEVCPNIQHLYAEFWHFNSRPISMPYFIFTQDQ